jgi:hypothetical protein
VTHMAKFLPQMGLLGVCLHFTTPHPTSLHITPPHSILSPLPSSQVLTPLTSSFLSIKTTPSHHFTTISHQTQSSSLPFFSSFLNHTLTPSSLIKHAHPFILSLSFVFPKNSLQSYNELSSLLLSFSSNLSNPFLYLWITLKIYSPSHPPLFHHTFKTFFLHLHKLLKNENYLDLLAIFLFLLRSFLTTQISLTCLTPTKPPHLPTHHIPAL